MSPLLAFSSVAHTLTVCSPHRPIPWGGIYAATKAALHSLSEPLYMECKPLHIHVLLLAPGAVKSNIASNQAERVQLPAGTLYAAYADAVLAKLTMGQRSSPTPTDVFSRQVVDAVLRKPAPPRYLTLASMSTTYWILRWFPRTWVLNLFWKRMGDGPRLAAQKRK